MPIVSAVAEANDEGIILFAPAYPGACGWGPEQAVAIERLRHDIQFTCDWLDSHGLAGCLSERVPQNIDIEITEQVTATGEPLECDSEGFFSIDQHAYDDAEASRTTMLLDASRGDVHDVIGALDQQHLDYRLLEGRRTVREIIDHIALAEHWYMTRVDAPVDVPSEYQAYPTDTFERLTAIRNDVEGFLESLTSVPADRRSEEWAIDGECWTVRKVLRRFVWHELLHYKQLQGVVPKVLAETR